MAWLVGSRDAQISASAPASLGDQFPIALTHCCFFCGHIPSPPLPLSSSPGLGWEADELEQGWSRQMGLTGVYRRGPPLPSPPELSPSFLSPLSPSQLPILFCLSLPPEITTLFLSPFWSSFALGQLRTKAVGVQGTKHARRPQMCQY